MTWSNQEFFKEISTLPENVYGLAIAEGEWKIGRLLTHLVGSSEWFRYYLGGPRWSNLIN